MKRTQAVDFRVDEFANQNKNVRWLCHTIINDGYASGSTNVPDNTIEWLNEILILPGFFDDVIAVKPSLGLTNEIKKLREETASIRNKLFKDLSDSEQVAIKRLNRLMIELAYPREAPKIGYELIALIKTKSGSCFLQDYENSESFNQDMKEHRCDIEWGLLVRCDEGRIISNYFSELGDKERVGLVGTEPKNTSITPEGLNPQQAALREVAIRDFKSNKAKKFISGQMRHINTSRQLGESIKFFFDSSGRPSDIASLEDIVSERKQIESKIRWLEAICEELRNILTKIKEIEDGALELLGQYPGKV